MNIYRNIKDKRLYWIEQTIQSKCLCKPIHAIDYFTRERRKVNDPGWKKEFVLVAYV